MTRTFSDVLKSIAWAYILLCFDINVGRINLLPDWVAYMMIYDCLPYITEKQRSAALLKNFVVLLGIYNGFVWILKIIGITYDLYFASIFVTVVYVYTHFQLLTNLADIAAEDSKPYSKTLTHGRNVALATYTATIIINRFMPLAFAVYTAAAINILAQIYLIYQLFLYSAHLADEQNGTIIENMEV